MKNMSEAISEAHQGRWTTIRCPAHEDRNPSLTVYPPNGDGWVRVKCWVGCPTAEILNAGGIKVAALGPNRTSGGAWKPIGAERPLAKSNYSQDKAAQRSKWPRFEWPSDSDLKTISLLRAIPEEGLRLAVQRGILRVVPEYRKERVWMVTDPSGRAAQARRMDGELWQKADGQRLKALSLLGSEHCWPIGLAAIEAKHEAILLCEGGPDLLAAHAFIHREGRDSDSAAVALLGASARICDDALPMFKGRRVRIVAHADNAGQQAAERWGNQLVRYATEVDVISFGSLRRKGGGTCKDLNDSLQFEPNPDQKASILSHLIP